MRPIHLAAGVILPLALFATASLAKNAPSKQALEFGDVAYDIAGPTPDGDVLSLSDLEITRDRAEAAALEMATDLNDGEDVALDTPLSDLPGLKDGEEMDEDLLLDFAARLGKRFALVPHPDKLAEAKTVGDLASWIAASEDAPILIVAWSPRCSMCKNIYDERMQNLLGETGTRVVALASNYPDKADHVREYLDANGYHWNVILDPEQRVTDRLGGRKTPHCFLLDADRKLRFRGGLDNDPRDSKEGDERKDYLRNAISAVKNGGDIEASMNETEPAG